MGKNNKFRKIINNLKNFFLNKNNFPLFAFLFIYILVFLPLCFINNDYFNLLAAFHIDSGSIIASIFTIMNKDIFYNQNMGYHTSYYGFPYNSIIFSLFVLIRKFFNLSVVDNFSLFALSARLTSFFLSVLTICFTYLLGIKILKNKIYVFFAVIFLALYPGFSFYTTLIKPDILALLFLTFSFFQINNYFVSSKAEYYISAAVFAALATFTKQQYIFICIPLILTFFIKEKYLKINLFTIRLLFSYCLWAVTIIIPIFFVIHPFAFIDFPYFFGRQTQLTGMTSAPIIQNFNFWIQLYVRYPIILLGFITILGTIIEYFFERKKDNAKKVVFLFSIFSFLYIIWLTLFVGPIRTNAYLIPIFSFITINVIYTFSKLLFIYKNINLKINKIFQILVFFIFFIIFIISFKNMLKDTILSMRRFYDFKKSFQVYVVKDVMSMKLISKEFNKSKIIFTVSLPFPQYEFEEAKNIWQFNFGKTFVNEIKSYDPDIIAVDTTKYYEQSYTWWKNTALRIGLRKNKIYLNNKIIDEADLKKNLEKSVIVIFYK